MPTPTHSNASELLTQIADEAGSCQPTDLVPSTTPRPPSLPRRKLPFLRTPAPAKLRHVQLEEETETPRIRMRWAAAGATVASSVANLANTNMGVGMLALPAAMANAGLVGGSALLLLSGLIAGFGSYLLAECVTVVGRPATLSTITAKALGVPGIVLTDVAVVIIGTSCAIGYLIVVGDMLPEIAAWLLGEAAVQEGSPLASREVWIMAALPVIVPLAFLRRLESLGAASSIVVGCVGLTLFTVMLFALAPGTFDPCGGNESSTSAGQHTSVGSDDAADASCAGDVVALRDWSHTMSASSTFLFAFAAQINVTPTYAYRPLAPRSTRASPPHRHLTVTSPPPHCRRHISQIPSIVSELRTPSAPRVLQVLIGGHAFTALAYLIVASAAYSTYGSNVRWPHPFPWTLSLDPNPGWPSVCQDAVPRRHIRALLLRPIASRMPHLDVHRSRRTSSSPTRQRPSSLASPWSSSCYSHIRSSPIRSGHASLPSAPRWLARAPPAADPARGRATRATSSSHR